MAHRVMETSGVTSKHLLQNGCGGTTPDTPKNDIMQKFSQNLRRMIESRGGGDGQPRMVKFNKHTVEQSFCGTERSGRIKDSSVLSDSSVVSSISSASTAASSVSVDISVNINDGKHYSDDSTRNGYSDNTDEQDSLSSLSVDVPSPRRNSASAVQQSTYVTPLSTPLRRHTVDRVIRGGGVTSTPECFKPVSLETPIKAGFRGEHAESLCDGSGITVAVRVRPVSKREQSEDAKCVVSMIDNETIVTPEKGDPIRFTYDYSFWSCTPLVSQFADQQYVYSTLAKPILEKAFDGYNTCLFAYGQTGSGKSYSMMGHGKDDGIIPRFCEDLVTRAESDLDEVMSVNIEISFFEIYNEKIHDLLCPSYKDKSGKKSLKVREHPVLGPYVEGLSSYGVKSFDDIKGWLSVGNKHRATAATGMNDKSSRSHSVFTLVLTQTKTVTIDKENHEHSVTSKINLVDLAGSERQTLAKTTGDRLREGASINKSLHTLGKVISQLCEQSSSLSNHHTPVKKRKFFIPYRDSVLTWLLKESLGGNSKTAMLATISPTAQHLEETLSTLRYAKQARTIINSARVNEDPKARLIRELRAEIEKLKSQTGVASEDTIGSSLMEIASLRERLFSKEMELQDITRSRQERLQHSEERKLEESMSLEKCGIALKMDARLPNLVNLNEDPQLSEMLLYVIDGRQIRVGRAGGTGCERLDIQLNGPLIGDTHCVIHNAENVISITPEGDAPTYVNGNLITGTTVLHHGDRVILGGDHYFRFNHPSDSQRSSTSSGSRKSNGQVAGGGAPPKDFEFARQELASVQNARLEAELEEARLHHEAELEAELRRQEEAAQQRMRTELERSQKKADRQLSEQRNEYEDRLAQLERMLKEHAEKEQESDQQRQETEHMMRELQREKLLLEYEVLSNRKRLDMEACAAQKVIEKSRVNQSRIVEQLEVEKRKMQANVEQLEALKTQRLTPLQHHNALADTPPSSQGTARTASSRKGLYRVALLLREANKIADLLNKNTVFSREDVMNVSSSEGTPVTALTPITSRVGEEQVLVKVSNTALAVSTFWTLDKFESRLLHMRELFQNSTENPDDAAGMETNDGDDVFFDSQDAWEKDIRIDPSPTLSPRLLQGLSKPGNSRDASVVRLSFSSADSDPRPSTASSAATCDKSSSPRGQKPSSLPQTSMISACRSMVTASLETCKGTHRTRLSFADHILESCEVVKHAVTHLVDTFNNTTQGDTDNEFATISTVQTQCAALARSIDFLLCTSALWENSFQSVSSSLTVEMCRHIEGAIHKLGSHIALLLQGCENDIDSVVQQSSASIIDCLYTICRHGGELSLATGTPVTLLCDTGATSGETDDQTTGVMMLGESVRQSFQYGCDTFLEKTLNGALKTMEENCLLSVTLVDEFQADISAIPDNILKQIDVLALSAKILVQRLLVMQSDLDNTLLTQASGSTSSEVGRPDDFYHQTYAHGQTLVAAVGSMSDGVTLLLQAARPMSEGDEAGGLRRILNCVDMVHKSCYALSSSSSSVKTPDSEAVDAASQQLKMTAMTISTLTRAQLPSSHHHHPRTMLDSPCRNATPTKINLAALAEY